MPDVPAAPLPVPAPAAAARLESVDLLRGLVMVVMALDHVRDFFHFGAIQGVDPLDLTRTTPAIFLTRFITHFCAPIFSFLAGVGVWLSLQRGKSRRELSGFLITRGLWLIFLELTVLMWFGWAFAVNLRFFVFATLWSLGWSMIFLAGFIHLPLRAVAIACVVLLAGHNAADGLMPESWGAAAWLWQILHVSGSISPGAGVRIWVFYPLLPWIAIMGLGYCAGACFPLGTALGRRRLVATGLGLLALFLILRGSNVYGNLTPWSGQRDPVFTALSFLDVTKYPPSLDYVLVTLGAGMLLLAGFDRGAPAWLRPLVVFGRVPFFYYLLHIPLIHGAADLTHLLLYGRADFGILGGNPPPNAGLSLAATYAVWLAVVVSLYPLCRWFADYKRRHRDRAWLGYF